MYFRKFKYLSDSRHRWREPIDEIIDKGYRRLHILTHPFWYNEEEKDLHGSVYELVNKMNDQRYLYLADNFTDLKSVMGKDEVR